jgi:hypothetical protein
MQLRLQVCDASVQPIGSPSAAVSPLPRPCCTLLAAPGAAAGDGHRHCFSFRLQILENVFGDSLFLRYSIAICILAQEDRSMLWW